MNHLPKHPRLEYDEVTVEFGATRALSNISFAVGSGEIIGLLGHNGAGKSTLFNVTSGAYGASSGSFRVDGNDIGGKITPRRAAELGITIIHQEPALAPNLTVLDNLFLGHPRASRRDRAQRAVSALHAVGSDIRLDMPVDTLSLGERQLVDLARGMLAGDMRVLLLDEPTAALGRAETEALHSLIRDLAAKDVAVLYVSHRLPDILEVCTRIVVLRGGEVVVDGPAAGFNPERLARALVPELREHVAVETRPRETGLRLHVADTFLAARKGEVVGMFGMAGGEQFDIAAQLVGLAGPTAYELNGKSVRIRNPRQAIKQRVFYVPPDRDTEGLVGSESAKDNVMLPWYRSGRSRGWWVSRRTGREIYATARAALDIRGPDGAAEASQFSGGNRQKLLLSRWLYPAAPNLLVLCQPTQGVDVGARLDIVDAVRTAAKDGATVLVASSESDEIASMCDRSYVVVGDRLGHVEKVDAFNEELLATLLSLAAPPSNTEPMENRHER